jgi:hypothetical protein
MTLPTTMPVVKAAAATVTDKAINLRLIQWIDDAGDIADDDDIVLTINGVALTGKVQIGTTAGGAAVEAVTPNVGNIVVWQIGPFNPGIHVTGLVVTTIDHGAVHVWYD